MYNFEMEIFIEKLCYVNKACIYVGVQYLYQYSSQWRVLKKFSGGAIFWIMIKATHSVGTLS